MVRAMAIAIEVPTHLGSVDALEAEYAHSVDAATVCTGTLADCKGAWIRESERVMRNHKPGRR